MYIFYDNNYDNDNVQWFAILCIDNYVRNHREIIEFSIKS